MAGRRIRLGRIAAVAGVLPAPSSTVVQSGLFGSGCQ
jgi:hypothetical protein